jgi:hypothetical protein
LINSEIQLWRHDIRLRLIPQIVRAVAVLCGQAHRR